MTDSFSRWVDPAAVGLAGAVPAGRPVRGRVTPPSSKSLTHRCFNLALLAGRPLTVECPLDAEDTRLFRGVLEAMGWGVVSSGETVRLDPPPARNPDSTEQKTVVDIQCGNAGTMFRFLLASLCTVPGRWRVDGVPRLRERPVGPLTRALGQLKARVEGGDYAPLTVHGGTFEGGAARLDAGASSQYLSALLMAGQRGRRPTILDVPALTSEPYVDLTLQALDLFGGRVERPAEDRFVVHPTTLRPPDRVRVEGDYSAAAYPAAAAVLTGGEVTLEGLTRTSRQGDRGFLALLERMGGDIRWRGDAVRVRGTGRLRAVEADLSSMPDQVPTLAALAPFARGITRITNVPHLRIKESDRLAAMASELARVGAQAEELADGLVIPGVWAEAAPPEEPVTTHSHDDHRIAMSLALIGLLRPGVTVGEPSAVCKSYPAFWRDLSALLQTG
ncbi:MAG: 3-phosphoshikimate 1-carboxyvinyltransferase [Acidobacteriota bacterium]